MAIVCIAVCCARHDLVPPPLIEEPLMETHFVLRRGRVDVLLSDEELSARRTELAAAGGYQFPPSQTPWQEIQRGLTGQMGSGAILEGAETFQRIAQTRGLPRDSH